MKLARQEPPLKKAKAVTTTSAKAVERVVVQAVVDRTTTGPRPPRQLSIHRSLLSRLQWLQQTHSLRRKKTEQMLRKPTEIGAIAEVVPAMTLMQPKMLAPRKG